MSIAIQDPKLWRSALVAGVISVALVSAAVIPVGILMAPLSLPASIVGVVYATRSLLRKEEKRNLAVAGFALSLVAPIVATYLFLFAKPS